MANNPNITVLPHSDCCGCRACGDICPVSCISFVKDDEGFLYPAVDESVCIHCGKCTRVCPELNPVYNDDPENVLAAYAASDDVRRGGSSGGLFGVIASFIIKQGGRVWGAAFDENLTLRHMHADTFEELRPLLRSKYLQSDTSGCFRQIAEDLKSHRLTLFCGTPCQCNALRNYIGRECDGLYLIDIICHGVPSQDLFDKSIRWVEEKRGCKVTQFAFRSKYKGALHPQAFSYIYEKNGKEHRTDGLHYQFPFYFGFQKYITLRPSCYTCKWARTQRAGDITLGDFWGVEKLDPALDPKTGVSEVLVNNKKGKALIEMIKEDDLIWSKSFGLSEILDGNGCLHAPTKLKPERAQLFADLRQDTFDEVVKKHLVSKRRWIFDLYYGMPGFLRKIVRRVMDKRMRYE